VLVVPQKYKPIDKIVFLYDGDPTSVFAIKTFSSLFPTFGPLPVEVVSVKNDMHPDNRLMKELMKQHYSNISYIKLEGSPKEEIPRYLKNVKENILVVIGAYGRNTVSRLFKPSLADTLMHDVKVPLFIAHNK
jgi:nucleotide-binding universal stress UspA family protein